MRTLALTTAVAWAAACSLEGLTSGGAGGAAGGTTSSSTATTSVGTTSSGGGGEPSPFSWLLSLGNDTKQGTSPYGMDAGAGSSLRVSEVGPTGDVWIAMATYGAMDPDADGPLPLRGTVDSYNVFIARVDAAGHVVGFASFDGDLGSINQPLVVSAVVRLDGDAVAVTGTFVDGSIALTQDTSITQTSPSQEDAFLVVLDGDGVVQSARHLTGGNHQSLRAAAVDSTGAIVVSGRIRRNLVVNDPVSDVVDAGCAYSAQTENFDRVLVARFDPSTLACLGFTTFGTSTANGVRSGSAVATAGGKVFVGGAFSAEIAVPTLPPLLPSAGEDGYLVSLAEDLGTADWILRASSNRFSSADGVRAIATAGGIVWLAGYFEEGTTPVGGMEPTVGIVNGDDTDDCVLPVPSGRDAFVARIDAPTGRCLSRIRLGDVAHDDPMTLAAIDGAAAIVGGFYTTDLPPLDTSFAGGSRDAFLAELAEGPLGELAVTGGVAYGGLSWDYLDRAVAVSGGTAIVAGSFALPFHQLGGREDYYVGKLVWRR